VVWSLVEAGEPPPSGATQEQRRRPADALRLGAEHLPASEEQGGGTVGTGAEGMAAFGAEIRRDARPHLAARLQLPGWVLDPLSPRGPREGLAEDSICSPLGHSRAVHQMKARAFESSAAALPLA